MKRLIIGIVMTVCFCLNVSAVFAIEWESVELLGKNIDSLLEKENGGYLFDFQGEQYIIGRNGSKYTLPVKLSEFRQSEEMLWTGNCYIARYCADDDYLGLRSIPVKPVRFYNEEFDLIAEKQFAENVCAIGYRDNTFYCQLFESGTVYKSKNMANWEKTDESIPRHTDKITYDDSSVSFDNKTTWQINYEDTISKKFISTLGNWIVKMDTDYNMYISNDNVYFAEIELPKEGDIILCTSYGDITLPFYVNRGFNSIKWYDLRCIYEYNNKIIADMEDDGKEILRLSISTDKIYSELENQKSAPYVIYDDKILAFEQPPVIENGRTLIPIRFLFEQMGATVDWDGDTQTATITQDNTAITFAIDNTEADVNGQTVVMDVPARLINGKTMVPLRFLSENLGYDVSWDGETRIITIE